MVGIGLDEVASFLEKLSKYSANVYWLSTPDFSEIRFISPAYEKIWGRSREELYANPELWITYLHPEDSKNRHLIREMSEKVAKNGQTARFEESYRIIRPNGEIRWIIDRGAPICDENGICTGVTGIAIDITEEKLANEISEATLENQSQFIENLRKKLDMILTRREIECLSLWLSGYSIKESSYQLNLSQKSIEAYRSTIKEKMQVNHKFQLINLIQATGTFHLFLSLATIIKNHPMPTQHQSLLNTPET